MFSGTGSPRVDALIRVIYIEGKIGTGTASLLQWFRQEMVSRGVGQVSIQLSPQDAVFNYRALVLLFQALVTHIGSLDRPEDQAQTIASLLEDMHGEASSDSAAKET
jgi:hypothetical protein